MVRYLPRRKRLQEMKGGAGCQPRKASSRATKAVWSWNRKAWPASGYDASLAPWIRRSKGVAVGEWVEPVCRAIGDERRDGDGGGQLAGRVGPGPPRQHGVRLGGHDVGRGPGGGRVARDRDEVGVLCGVLAGREQVGHRLLRVAAGERVDGLLGRPHRRSVARVAGAQDQAAHLVRVEHGQCLGDHAAHRPAEDVRLSEAERGDERAGLVGHRVDAERSGQGLGLADAGVVEDHDVVALGEGIDEAPVPALHGRAVAGDQDQGWPAPDGPVCDRAQPGVRDSYRGGRDRDRVRDLGRRSRPRLRHGRSHEGLHRSDRGRPQVGVGEIPRVRPGFEQDEVKADLDPRGREGPCVRGRCAGDPRERQRPDGGRGLLARDGDRGCAAVCQGLGEASPRLLRFRACGQDLDHGRDRGSLDEGRGRVRQPLLVGRHAFQTWCAGLHAPRAGGRCRPSGWQVSYRQQAGLERGPSAVPPAPRGQHGRRREHGQPGNPGAARRACPGDQASGTSPHAAEHRRPARPPASAFRHDAPPRTPGRPPSATHLGVETHSYAYHDGHSRGWPRRAVRHPVTGPMSQAPADCADCPSSARSGHLRPCGSQRARGRTGR